MQEAFEKVAKDEATEYRARSYVEEYSLLAVYYRVSRNSFPVEGYVWWVSAEEKHTSWWCAICGERYDCKAPNRLLVVQTFESVNQAEVFRAHAVPQGLCGNLISALKLLANQQEDGDGPTQSIVTNLCEGAGKVSQRV